MIAVSYGPSLDVDKMEEINEISSERPEEKKCAGGDGRAEDAMAVAVVVPISLPAAE